LNNLEKSFMVTQLFGTVSIWKMLSPLFGFH